MGCNCGNKNKTVVSTVPTTTTELCSCGKPKSECGKGTCGCKHEQKPCLEDHSVTLVESVYTTTVTATDTWVMPAVDDCVQLHLKDVTNILPGSILWNKSVGYLHVSSYDASSGYVTACNEGEDGNAEVGSTFPSCMSFHVGIPTQCTCDDGYTGACLAADVTSPGVGETTEVSVTTVSGLFIGDIIDIAGYMYKIVAITDINTITVKNEGFGAPIGTVIKNDPNCTGKPCTVKITVVNSDDPCAKDPVNEGVIIVCDEGERKPFEGTADNQIAVWDNEDKKWKLKTVKLEEECTNTTVDVTLDPLVSVYVVTVEKTSIFTVGDIVYLDGRKFTVDSIINSTQMRIAIDEAPSAITVVEEGAAICLGDCCENLPGKFSGFNTGNNSMNFTYNNIIAGDGYELTSSNDEKNISSDLPTITLATPNTNGRPVTVLGTITIVCQSQFRTDTHTFNLQDPFSTAKNPSVSPSISNVSQYHVLCTAGGPGAELIVNPNLDSNPIYSESISSGRSYYLALDKYTGKTPPVGTDDSEWNPCTQAITLPLVFTITNPSNSHTITFTASVKGYNIHEGDGAGGSSKYNEDIHVRIRQIRTTVALAWIIQ